MPHTYLNNSFIEIENRCDTDCGVEKNIEIALKLTRYLDIDNALGQFSLLLYVLYIKGISCNEIVSNINIIIESYRNGTPGMNVDNFMDHISDEEIDNLYLKIKTI